MINLVQDSSVALVKAWKNIVEENGGIADIKIDSYVRSFSGDVIARACFGGNYSKGEEIFLRLSALQEAASKKMLVAGIPGLRYTSQRLVSHTRYFSVKTTNTFNGTTNALLYNFVLIIYCWNITLFYYSDL